MVTIHYSQTKSYSAGPPQTWTVTTTISSVDGGPKELFVHRTESRAFSHVAIPRNIDDYPPSYDEALVAGTPFYRQASVAVSFDQQATARAAAEDYLRRLAYFTQNWEAPAFSGTETGTIDAEGTHPETVT